MTFTRFDVAKVQATDLPYAIHAGAKSMLRDDELRMLFHLARDVAEPGMALIDAGAFTGGSTVALAAGLAARPDRDAFLRSVHSYDRFEITSEFYKRLLFDQVDLGGSFLPHYMHNISPWNTYINVYPGDFLKAVWLRQPISVLFCDISKTTQLDLKVWRSFVPYLVPGTSVLVQQDLLHVQSWYLHIALGEFIDHFDVLGLVESSLVLGLRKAIDPEALGNGHKLATTGSLADQLDRLDRLIARTKPVANREAIGSLEVVKAVIAARQKDHALAGELLESITATYADIENPHFKNRIRYAHKVLDGQEIART